MERMADTTGRRGFSKIGRHMLSTPIGATAAADLKGVGSPWPIAVEFAPIEIIFDESPASLSLRGNRRGAQAACPWAGPTREARGPLQAWLTGRAHSYRLAVSSSGETGARGPCVAPATRLARPHKHETRPAIAEVPHG
jgi:hypothetical protein